MRIQVLLHYDWVQNRMKVEKVVAGGELNNINSSGEKIFDGHSNRAMVCKIE